MKEQTAHRKDACDSRLLSRFADGEVSAVERDRVSRHLTHCQTCRNALNRIRLLADTCESFMDTSRFQKDLAGIEGRIMGRIKRPVTWGERAWHFVRTRWVLVPASAAGTILAVFITIQMFFTAPTTPSAIVTSMTGDVSSVMVMETPQSHQTIIWISEDS